MKITIHEGQTALQTSVEARPSGAVLLTQARIAGHIDAHAYSAKDARALGQALIACAAATEATPDTALAAIFRDAG